VKLSFLLFRQDVKAFADCIKEDYPGLDPIDPDKALPFDAAGYWVSLAAKPPKWSPFIEKYFSVAGVENQGHGFLLLLKTSGRFFAVSFGYGFLAINRANLERNFGIKAAANAIGKDNVRMIDSRTIDLVTRQQRVNLSEEASIPDFSIDVDHEWVRFLSGSPLDKTIASSLAGSDSLQINSAITFNDLPSKCAQLLGLFNSTDYKKRFPFLDYFIPVKSEEPVKQLLDSLLKDAVEKRSVDRISLALPEAFLDLQRLDRYKIYSNKAFIETEGLSIAMVYEFLNNHPDIDDPVNKVKIVGLDDQDQPTTKANSLYEFFVFETEFNQKTYTISAGAWFLIDNNYAATTRSKVRAIEDLTASFSFTPMRRGEAEGVYNKRLQQENKTWTVLDAKNITLDEPHQRVEACDLLTQENQFLCVKKMNRSSTLSHLFCQGSVSAVLLHDSAPYRNAIVTKANGRNANLLSPVPVFVFCIATERPGTIANELFLFSAINLLNHARTIERLGYKVAVAKIPIT